MLILELMWLVLLPLTIGWAFLRNRGLSLRSDPMGFLAWAYLGGCLLLAPPLLLWTLLERPGNGLLLGFLVFGIAFYLGFRAQSRVPQLSGSRGASQPARVLAWLGIGLISLLCAEQVMAAALVPVSYGDEANIWAAKAHVLFEPGPAGRAVGLQQYVLHADYPLLNPLVQVWAFAVHGGIDPYLGRVAIQIYVFAMLLALGSAVARHASSWLVAPALLLLFMNENSLQQASWACSDLILATGLLVAVDAWLRWREDGSTAWLSLHTLGICTVLWSKNEGLMLGLIWFGILVGGGSALRSETRRAWLLQLLPCLLVVGVGIGFNLYFGLANDLFNPDIGESGGFWSRLGGNFTERLGPVSTRFAAELCDPEEGRLLIPCFLALCIGMGPALWRSELRELSLLVIAGLAGYVAVFIATNRVLGWHLETAADRVIYHLLPVAALGLAIGIKQLLPPRASALTPTR